ncbi:MAG: recombination factor protein RarA [Candidatus Amesbacteria bacterium GW2011_GWB1_48_13]|uniref:Recombination factor protein RarA n=1 Tax=Candidatus Amesbacteria bacterium GW2011_GWB1_48_13 TaxID=1618362 RepID=A0A0G1UNJ3_9BACT|nr:MAG: recombination factor protein RarA [Candidatus Amesbacteria bacterium GW2011_GWB1_48_13]
MDNEPLAERLRPGNLDEFVGQEHLTGKSGPLRSAIEKKHLFSFILWGPPGTGKTTLARIYAGSLGAEFHQLSAVSAGKEDVKKVISLSLNLRQRRVLFLDEIHRFNKAQQDYLLPYVENGAITFIGATTENPSFEVISPLLSRCRVFTLKELETEDLKKIGERVRNSGIKIGEKEMEWAANFANGDARQFIGLLESTAKLYKNVSIENFKLTLQTKALRYDKGGEEHFNTISAFIKTMRAGDTDAALYYLARMVDAGEDPLFIARRMVVFASEDVASPTALVVADAVFRACETVGLPECQENLAAGTVYLAQTKKDRRAYEAYMKALSDVRQYGNLPVPLSIRNPVTKLMKSAGYGKGYEMYTKDSLLPK